MLTGGDGNFCCSSAVSVQAELPLDFWKYKIRHGTCLPPRLAPHWGCRGVTTMSYPATGKGGSKNFCLPQIISWPRCHCLTTGGACESTDCKCNTIFSNKCLLFWQKPQQGKYRHHAIHIPGLPPSVIAAFLFLNWDVICGDKNFCSPLYVILLRYPCRSGLTFKVKGHILLQVHSHQFHSQG